MALLAWGLISDDGFLRGPNGTVLHSPVLKGFISVLFIMAAVSGIVYGYVSVTFRKLDNEITGMNSSFKSLVSFLVLVFFAAQFVSWSNGAPWACCSGILRSYPRRFSESATALPTLSLP